MKLQDILSHRIVLFDGGMGTLLQEQGLSPGGLPELWNIEHPEIIQQIHKAYCDAGADILTTNTFGANPLKLSHGCPYDVQILIQTGVRLAKEVAGTKHLVALDIGPTGKLLKPIGDLSFEDAYASFATIVKTGVQAGADLILIETMADTYELKAAVLAAKEHSTLPVLATVVLDERGKLLTGSDVAGVVALLEGLRVDAIGVNCGLGPIQLAPFVEEILSLASVPVIVNPNAGLPRYEDGKTIFDIDAETFANTMKQLATQGAWILGGCCGTTPLHIAKLKEKCENIKPVPITPKTNTIISSYAKTVFANTSLIIGERINPTGKARFKKALCDGDMDYILNEGFSQQEAGAHILDVNVGLPEIKEEDMLPKAVQEIQAVIDLPLQIDTSNILAMERALRLYNGKAMINSVSGKTESMHAIFPLVARYGGVVVGLALDENGIPETIESRLSVAKKIVDTAQNYGISKKDIVIDVLCMTISAEPMGAMITLEAVRRVKEELGVKTILGVSNISFGLPQRAKINATFYTMALQSGLDFGIVNPNSTDMMQAYDGYRALCGLDEKLETYISRYGNTEPASKIPHQKEDMSLGEAIEKGLHERASIATQILLQNTSSLKIIDEELIPALDRVGKRFEKGTVFLPQLLMSAEAAKAAFEVIQQDLLQKGEVGQKRGKIILATVKGDVHDIGKNIVKALLENYRFDVIDLGKDVDPQKIVDTALQEDVRLVGLSALMTTTVPNMEETIRRLHKQKPDCQIMVGGAVLTQSYADSMGADCYSKDAMGSVEFAKALFPS